ncbi:MAG: hypothetical protein H7067_01880 [Burkholderiales bacterium]|nr:hypothetical protein [Opitutaceae bacterium]
MKTLRIATLLSLFAALLPVVGHAADSLTPEGTFEAGLGYNGAPEGWDLNPGDWRNKPNLALKIMNEGASPDAEGKNYLRLINTGSPEEGMFRLSLSVLLPSPAPTKVVLGWRIRAQIDELSGTQEWSSVQCEVYYLDKKGQTIGTSNGVLRMTRSTAGKWLERETTLNVPPGTAEISMFPGLYLIKGTVDFDDISLAVAQ